jgi:hypothetical protein
LKFGRLDAVATGAARFYMLSDKERAMVAVKQMIDDFERFGRMLRVQLAYVESGHQVHEGGRDSRAVTEEWKERLRRSIAENVQILISIRQSVLHAHRT